MATSLTAASDHAVPWAKAGAHFGKTLAGAFSGLGVALQAELESAVQASKRQTAETLNQATRRLRSVPGEARWSAALADAAAAFASRAAVFTFEGGNAYLSAARGLETAGPLAPSPLRSAPAFVSAVETGEPVVAMRAPSEMPAFFAAMTGAAGQGRFHLFPVRARGRVVAAIYADGEDDEVDAANLELLAAIAGPILDANSVSAARPPSWDDLPLQDKSVHLRAQRIVRVRVAEIRLNHDAAVRSGRLERDLYGALQSLIDASRDEFLREFAGGNPSMPDYFHLELLRTLANGDEELLGPEYPGPLA